MLSTGAKALLALGVLGLGYAATRKSKPRKPSGRVPGVLIPVPIPSAVPVPKPGTYTSHWTPDTERRARESIEYYMGQVNAEPDLEPHCPTMYVPDENLWIFEEAALYAAQEIWPDQDWPSEPGVSPDWVSNVWDRVVTMARNMMCPNWQPIT